MRKQILPHAHGPSSGVDAEPEDWFAAPLRGRADLEWVPGLDGRTLLYDPQRRQYSLLSPAAAALFARIDGCRTGYELASLRHETESNDDASMDVIRFLTRLRDAGLLDIDPVPVPTRSTLARVGEWNCLLRLPLCRSLPRVLHPVCRAIDRTPRSIGRVVLLLAAAALALTIALAVAQSNGRPTAALWILLPLLSAQIVTHELAHALMCQWYGVPVREAGIGLLFYIVPVAYIDYTDAYRLTERRPRVIIALAGPINDLLWAGGYAVVVLVAHGAALQVGHAGLLLGLLAAVGNLTPILPGDGFQALEAGLGCINLRGRVVSMLVGALLGTSSSTAAGNERQRPLYLALGVLWLLLVAATLVAFVIQLSSFVVGALG